MYNAQIDLKMYKAAIFDMDGTMINNMPYHQKAWLAFLNRHKVTITEAEFTQQFSGKKNSHILKTIFEHKLSEEDLQKYTEEKETLYRSFYESEIKEVDGLTDIIEALLQNGLRLAIATTAPKRNRDFGLKALGLENTFETILGDEHVTRGKPHPEIYLSAAKQLDIAPKECIVFEDTPAGVIAGKDAGMTVVGILTSHTAEELKSADFIVDDFTHIKLI